jgi:hypothetical protein
MRYGHVCTRISGDLTVSQVILWEIVPVPPDTTLSNDTVKPLTFNGDGVAVGIVTGFSRLLNLGVTTLVAVTSAAVADLTVNVAAYVGVAVEYVCDDMVLVVKVEVAPSP